MVIIEFEAADIHNAAQDGVDRDCFYVTVSDPGNVLTCGAVYILSNNSYRSFYNPTAVAD